MSIDLNIIILAAVSFISVVLLGLFIRARLQLSKSIEITTQLWFDRTALQEEIEKLTFLNSNSTDIENGFIKFLSESREQAFLYIEDVQVAIQQLDGAMQLGDEEQIAQAYINLISFLPQESQDVVK